MRWTWNAALLSLAAVLPSGAEAGWPFSAEGPRRGTPEWYEAHAGDPIGQRQRFKFGKVWPAVPRPMGEPVPCVHKFHHNLYWPHPYLDQDKQSVKDITHIQVTKGWTEATTLYDYHFDPETQVLNSAGRDHLYWIMSNVPMQYRMAYVQASRMDPAISEQRLVAVQSEAAKFVGAEQLPPVMLRVATPTGTPAVEIDAIFQYRRDNLTPTPVLQSAGGGGGGET
jgi:hypothetical protein